MEKTIKRITNIIIIVLTAIAVIAAILIPFTAATTPEAVSASREMSLSIGAIGMYILLIIALVSIVAFAFFQVASNKKQLISMLILLGVVAAIVLLSYIFASSELSKVASTVGISEGLYKWIGTGVNVAHFAFAGVLFAWIGSFVYIKIKK